MGKTGGYKRQGASEDAGTLVVMILLRVGLELWVWGHIGSNPHGFGDWLLFLGFASRACKAVWHLVLSSFLAKYCRLWLRRVSDSGCDVADVDWLSGEAESRRHV